MIKGAIFDLDGTLLDSMFFWDTIGESYLRSLNYEPKSNLNETFKNMDLHQAVCYYQTEYGVTLSVEEMINSINELLRNYYRNKVSLKAGVKEFLEQLKSKGVKMCIATATDYCIAEETVNQLGIAKYFSNIFTCTSVGHGKSEPNIYRDALNHLKTEKEKTLVFEDALYAIRTAKNDGFITIAVHDKYEKDQIQVREIADFYIPSFNNLFDFWSFVANL